jgi:hypothetical protein
LVVLEIALALVALVGSGLFIRSMQNAQRIDPGFESKKLFVFAFDLGALHYDEGRAQQYFRAAIERAKAAPGVESATIASNFPLGGGLARTVFPEGQDEASGYRGTLTELNDIAPNFFETLRIPLVGGREFSDADRKDTKQVAIINEAMAKQFWPDQNVVGKRFHFFGETQLREVVGVVRNTVVNNIGEEPQPLAYLPLTQDFSPAVTMQVRTNGRPEAVISSVRGQVQSLVQRSASPHRCSEKRSARAPAVRVPAKSTAYRNRCPRRSASRECGDNPRSSRKALADQAGDSARRCAMRAF